jgi:hypothetical protein
VALEFPDKLYMGTFQSSSRFDAHLDETGVSLTLDRAGDADARKSVRLHFHYALFAEVLRDLAETVALMPPEDAIHRDALRTAAETLYRALCAGTKPGSKEILEWRNRDNDDLSELTPEEQVLLLHCLE